MASYSVRFKRSAARELEALGSKRTRARILARIAKLAETPRPPGAKKLSGANKYRVRQGSYRILYTIDDHVVTVIIVRVAHRRDAYR